MTDEGKIDKKTKTRPQKNEKEIPENNSAIPFFNLSSSDPRLASVVFLLCPRRLAGECTCTPSANKARTDYASQGQKKGA
jgi:hypothetical protein